MEEAARVLLGLDAARFVLFDDLPWPKGVADGEITDFDYHIPLCKLLPVQNVEILVPITFGGRVSHILVISPGTERPSLVTRHLNYMQTIGRSAVTGSTRCAGKKRRSSARVVRHCSNSK